MKNILKERTNRKDNKKISAIYKEKGVKKPEYQGELPEGNNGLGLFLLGVTGDQVLDNKIYQKIKKITLTKVKDSTSRYSKRRSSTKHLYFLY